MRAFPAPAILLLLAACGPMQLKDWEDQGREHARARKWAEAVEDYTQCITLAPYYEHYVYRGRARAHLKDFDGAIADFKKALELRGDAPCADDLALAVAAKGDVNGGLDLLLPRVLPANTSVKPDPAAINAFTRIAGVAPQVWLRRRGEERLKNGEAIGGLADLRGAIRLSTKPEEEAAAKKILEDALNAAQAEHLKRAEELVAKGELLNARLAYEEALDVRKFERWGRTYTDAERAKGFPWEAPEAREGYERTAPGALTRAANIPAMTLWQKGTVDGRSLEIHIDDKTHRFPVLYQDAYLRNGIESDDVPNTAHFELRDAATGDVLLPYSWNRLAIVPGDGVYLLSIRERMLHGNAFLGGDVHRRLLLGAVVLDKDLPRWRKFDLKTRLAMPTDVVHLERFKVADPLQPAQLLVRRAADRSLVAETVSPDGATRHRYEQFQPEIDWSRSGGGPSLIRSAGQLKVLKTSARVQLLGASLDPLGTSERPLTVFTNGKTSYFGSPTEGEDLWKLLDATGTPTAPDGVTGFRPFGHARWAAPGREGRRWLVRFAMPGEAGYVERPDVKPRRWGLAEWDFSKMSAPLWDTAELVAPPTMRKNPTYTGAAGEQRDRPQSFYDHVILVTSVDGEWLATTVENPLYPGLRAEAAGKSKDESLGALLNRDEEALASDLAALVEAVRIEKENAERRKAWIREQWAALPQRGRETWVFHNPEADRELWDETAFASTSLTFLENVWKGRRGTVARRGAVFDRWYQLARKSTVTFVLRDACNSVGGATFDPDWSVPDKEAKSKEFYDLMVASTQEAKDKAKRDAEALAAAQAAAERQAIEAEWQRIETRRFLSMPLPGGKSFSWTPPPNPSQERYEMDAYKRNLDRVIQGKSWTPYGY